MPTTTTISAAPSQYGALRPHSVKTAPATAGPRMRARLEADCDTPMMPPRSSLPAWRETRLVTDGLSRPMPIARSPVATSTDQSAPAKARPNSPTAMMAPPAVTSRASPKRRARRPIRPPCSAASTIPT